MQFPSDRLDLRTRFPDDCHFCKAEEEIRWRQWWQGPDITEAGGNVPVGQFHHRDVMEDGVEFLRSRAFLSIMGG